MQTEQEVYNQLSYYTLSHPDISFIHQNIVDAFTAQTADRNTKPIAITFALVGLYLYLEKGFSGKQVQKMHMKMGKSKTLWPKFDLPKERGGIRVDDVLPARPGVERDNMIHEWCESVWKAYSESHEKVTNIAAEFLR